MGFKFNYTYKTYPDSPKATKYSKMLGLLTCNTMYSTLSLLIIFFIISFMSYFGFSDGVCGVIGIALFVLSMTLIRKKIRTHFERRIDAIAGVKPSFEEFGSPVSKKKSSKADPFGKSAPTPPASTYTPPSSTNTQRPANNDVIFEENPMYIDL